MNAIAVNRVWRMPHSPGRRRLLQAAALACGTPSGVSLACSTVTKRPSTSGSPSGQPGIKPVRGGTLNYAGGLAGSTDTQGQSFDPDIQTQYAAQSYGLFYERLLAYNLRTYALEPELAQKWEQPSPTEYVFHLQPGVKWQNKPPVNGRPLTTDDILWTLERAQTNNPKFYSRALLTLVDKTEAPDASTIRIATKSPDASALLKLSAENLFILAREVFEKYPKPLTAGGAVGTGAFVMNSVEATVGAEYTRNPTYWKQGFPYLDGFRTRHFGDTQTAWAAFLAGQVDICAVPGSESKNYVAQQGAGFTPDWKPAAAVAFQYPNVRTKLMSDARVTRALRLLINHDEFISDWAENQYGRGGYSTVFPAALAEWDLTQDEYRQHLEWKQPKDDAAKEALSLLSAAGYTKDNPLRFTLNGSVNPTLSAAVQLTQAQWKQLSQGVVDAQLKLTDQATIDSIRATSNFTYAYFGHSAGMVEPDSWLSSTYRSGGSLNFMGLSDPALDVLIDKQRSIFDDAQRRAAVKEVVSYIADHGPSTIPSTYTILDATQAKVHDYAPEHGMNGRQYQWVWLSA